MWVGAIDVHDDGLLRSYWEAGNEGNTFERPYASERPLEVTTLGLRESSTSAEVVPIAAVEQGEVLGVAELVMPKLDNTHLVYLDPVVRPAHLRKGVGTALLEAGLQVGRDRGRTTAIVEVSMPFATPMRSAGSLFLDHHGFRTASLEIHRILEVPVDDDRLDALAERAAPLHPDYRLESFTDRVPDELMEGYCALQTAFNSLAPLGELDLQPERWDEDRVRKGESRGLRMGRRTQSTVAVDQQGAMVALTEMMTSLHTPGLGWQSGTLVLPDHRGHRLGMAVKVANQRLFQRANPSVRRVDSWNAEENGPMIAINDALGFRAVEYTAETQRLIDPVPDLSGTGVSGTG